jgi:hypothetical protein
LESNERSKQTEEKKDGTDVKEIDEETVTRIAEKIDSMRVSRTVKNN